MVIGGSAGALEPLRMLVAGLRRDLDVAVFVTIHTSPNAHGALDRVLARTGSLPVSYAIDLEPIKTGHIYLAPPDHHLLVHGQHIRLGTGPRENGFRPAIDAMFRTAAASHGSQAIGVLLSGGLDDGVAGLYLLNQAGAVTVVQDPEEAVVPSMSQAAIESVQIDHVLRAAAIAPRLDRIIRRRQASREQLMTSNNGKREEHRDSAEIGRHDIHRAAALGPPSPFTCPDCGGTLWQAATGEILQFQCHIGHRYGADSLVAAQADSVDEALWTALRALEEHAELQHRLAAQASQRGLAAIGNAYEERAMLSEHRAQLIRRVLMPDASVHEIGATGNATE